MAAQEGWEASTGPLRATLYQIAELAPLVAAGVVAWIPRFDRAFDEAMDRHSRAVDLTIDDLDLDGLPLVEQPPLPSYGQDVNPYYSPWDDVHFATADVATDLAYCGNGDRLQALFANALALRIAPRLVELRGSGSDARVTSLHKIALLAEEMSLPTSAEVVAVRQNSEAFNDWRLALGRALEAVELETDVTSARQIVDGELSLPRQKVNREVDQSKLLSAARRAGTSLGWSILGLVLLAAGAGPPLCGVALASAAVAEWSKEYLQQLRVAGENRALLAHYLSFEGGAGGLAARASLPAWAIGRPTYRSPQPDAD